jgi:transposase InsO family protein
MESFFSSLKTERTARKVYRSRDEAKADVFDYVERFYNGVRTHRSLNKDAPVSRLVQCTGVIRSRALLGGLHYQYCRV